MISGSPQRYFLEAPSDVPREVLENAVAQAERVERHGLAAVLTLAHLSEATGVPYSHLRKVVARESDPYDEFSIRRDGGRLPRVISSPQSSLRRVQSWILRNILNECAPHSQSYAYERGKSIAQCAGQHIGATWMLKVDLHDFFHAVDETQVFDILRERGYQPLVSLEMARLCTRMAKPGFPRFQKYSRVHSNTSYDTIPEYKAQRLGFLPQGSPSSGALANLASIEMDSHFEGLAKNLGMTYTRYADDMTFSTTGDYSRQESLHLLRRVSHITAQSGFEIHKRKTKIITPGSRKIVLGLLVDGEKVRLTRATRRRIDDHLRCARKFGCRDHANQRGFQDVLGFIRHLTGLLNFAYDVDPEWVSMRRQAWEDLLADQGFRPSYLYRL